MESEWKRIILRRQEQRSKIKSKKRHFPNMLLNHFKYVRRIHTVSNQLPTGRAYAPCFRHHHHDDLQSMQSINLTLMEIYSNCQVKH